MREYLAREIPHRTTAERLLLEALPPHVDRVLDLGTGDGRMLGLVLSAAPDANAVGIDASEEMLARARQRFASQRAVRVRPHDFNDPLDEPGPFDVVVSGLALHHLEHERKRALFGEIHAVLRPGGLFANLDLFAPPNAVVHRAFREAIGRVQDDPEDRLAKLHSEIAWLEQAGFAEVDCRFKWLELALITAVRA